MFAFFRFAFGNVAHLQSLRSQSPLSTYEREQNKKENTSYFSVRNNEGKHFASVLATLANLIPLKQFSLTFDQIVVGCRSAVHSLFIFLVPKAKNSEIDFTIRSFFVSSKYASNSKCLAWHTKTMEKE